MAEFRRVRDELRSHLDSFARLQELCKIVHVEWEHTNLRAGTNLTGLWNSSGTLSPNLRAVVDLITARERGFGSDATETAGGRPG